MKKTICLLFLVGACGPGTSEQDLKKALDLRPLRDYSEPADLAEVVEEDMAVPPDMAVPADLTAAKADLVAAKPDLTVVPPDMAKPDLVGVKPDLVPGPVDMTPMGPVDLVKPTARTGLVINEVDYDQISPPDDDAEFIEIYNNSAAAVSLTDLSLVFVNGGNNTEYLRVALGGVGMLDAWGYLVVASGKVNVDPKAKKILFAAATDNIQNGAPDAVALIDTKAGKVIDALSYEGEIKAGMVTGLGAVNFVEGMALATSVADSNTEVGSLVRAINGTDTDNANGDWKYTKNLTPGAANP